ncbi:MAG: NB-ARC domain-containing protein, partial [Cyanobacteria bacterium P01_D01_bin.73]
MDWTNTEDKEVCQGLKQFRLALQDVYRNYSALKRFAQEECGLRLSAIAGDCSVEDAAFELIDHASAKGKLEDLLEAFQGQNPKHSFVVEFLASEESQSPEPEEEDCAEECEEVESYLCQAPPVPGYFVPRPEYSNQIRDRLLSDEIDEPGTLVVSALQGLGGIGKSVLAADLARQGEVRSRFPDGVLWVTLGQTPDLLKLLGGWITALGDREYSATTVDAASAYLRSLLADKTMLLVVDDLWNVADFEPFRLSGKGCRVLVTTREAKVPGIPERAEVRLGVMSLEEGLRLVELRLGEALSAADRGVFATFAEEVEFLPLAFDLITSQVADGYDWLTLLEDFRDEFDVLSVARSGGDEVRRLRSLRACFNLSLRRLDREVLRRFAWLGVLPEDVAVDARMARVLWEVSPVEARRQLLDFLRRGLMLSGPKVSVAGRSIPTFRQHDLLHDLATDLLAAPVDPLGDGDSLPGLGLSVEIAHGSLLDRYLPASGCWADLTDDGYIHGRLTWHMERAGRVREIHQLIRQAREDGRNGWYEACEELGQLTIFVEDVARAWRLAEETYGIIPREPEGWEWQMWCAFVTVSLNSLVGNVPAALIAALVEKGVWSEARGLAYAMQKRKEGDRERAIAALVPHFSSRELVNEALKAARAMFAGGDDILLAVVKHRQEFVENPVAIAREISSESSRASALSSLADKQPELLPEALEVAREISNEYDRARALSSLADKLTVELLPEALEVAREISNEYDRARALSSLADKLTVELLPEAL